MPREQLDGVELGHLLPTLWITADHHFGHANIVAYAGRPSSAADQDREMAEMIARANERRLGGRVFSCPLCGSPMEPKSGKRGMFLSCTLYPACKGSRDLPSNGR